MKKKTKSKKTGKFYVYILECSDGYYYTGYTNDLFARLAKHNAGLASKCTRARLPVKLVWSKKCSGKSIAMRLEYKIKQLARKEKEKLVRADEQVEREPV